MAFRLEDKLLKLAQVFSLVANKSLTLKEAAQLSNYSYWHLTRLYKRHKQDGLKKLFKRNRRRRPRKFRESDIVLLKNYYLKLNRPQISLLLYFFYLDYPDFPKLSGEWVRKLLIKQGVYSVGNRRKVFRKRFEAPVPGLLVQGDSSLEQFIPKDERYYQLIVFLDDCSRVCLAAKLVEKDTIDEHFELLKGIIKKYGKFVALYYDNDEKYSYIRHGNSRFFEYKKEKADLQVVRALSELGISVINTKAFDPCGKGKIERFILTAKLQLPVWFWRYQVKTLRHANQVLKRYIKYYNTVQRHREIGMTPYAKFRALKKESKFIPVSATVNLRKIFAYRYERKVDRSNTLRFEGTEYQLERKPFVYSYCGKKAEIRYARNKRLMIFVDGESVRYKKLLTMTKQRVNSQKVRSKKVAIL
jgi:transposase InsO family protein